MDARLERTFVGVDGKRLAAVECISMGSSNQHELNASRHMVAMLGTGRRKGMPCTYVRLGAEDEILVEESTITYYDARENHPTRSEHRMTYPAGTEAMTLARAGDLCWVAVRRDGGMTVVVADQRGAGAQVLSRLFETPGPQDRAPERREGFVPGLLDSAASEQVGIDEEAILAAIGVEVEVGNQAMLGRVLEEFGSSKRLPTAKELATFVRGMCEVDARTDPDGALDTWFTATTEMFLGLERHVLQPMLDEDFANQEHIDVGLFFEVAKQRMNSRFSRAGTTFESHLAALFEANDLTFTPQSTKMPDGSKPDFLFPDREAYDDPDVVDLVTFLGAKTTARERWMQLVAEAPLVTERHLATMDSALNPSLLRTMHEKHVHPIMPMPLILRRYNDLSGSIMSTGELVALLRERQAAVTLRRAAS